MKIKIRKFRKEDAAQVMRLNRGLSEAHGGKAIITARQISTACLRGGLAHCLVAEAGAQVVGFVMSYDWMNFQYGTRVCTVSELYTEARFRRGGIGLALMRRAAQEALKRGCFRMVVVAMKDNKGANGFYRKAGFSRRKNNTNRYALQNPGLRQFAKG